MRKFDDSAQLLLLAAFAIGFTLVITTIMLNNVIYASNMASESTSDISNYEISNIAQMTDEATRAAYNDSKSYSDETARDANITAYIDSYANEISTIYAFRGLSLSFDDSNLTEAYFTENGLYSGNSDWDVVKNVNRTDIFTIELTNTSKLVDESNAYEVYLINQSNGTVWSMKVYNDSTHINISVNNQIVDSKTPTTYMMLNITGVSSFNFNKSTTKDPYMIKFVNSSNAMGYYSISGGLADGSSFVEERYKVTNTTISVASSNNKINVSIPFTIP
ncbi:hypothetical protein J7W08_07455 [Methanococcoides orientis]|uniref:DUF7261 family protein n=1 Tax=Methanococcoides orientis TaxID=2822137 RepID=UPI001E34484B|nr:hypothetical protein [Methanococcoides orientis]UGV39957.1 hypothetical protein J7W08_07455 [Methanococcoides orientis]